MNAREFPAESTTSLPVAPRLGIGHLFLWMTCSAMLITANVLINRNLEGNWGYATEEQRLFEGIQSIVEGPSVAAIFIWVARKRRGLKFPVLPGEWFLVLQGGATVLLLSCYGLWSLGWFDMEQGSKILLLPIALIAAGYFLVAVIKPLPKWWRIALVCMTGYWCCPLANLFGEVFLRSVLEDWLEVINTCSVFFSLVPCVALLCGLVIDSRHGLQRSWLHTTGVFACLATLLVDVGQYLYYWLFLWE